MPGGMGRTDRSRARTVQARFVVLVTKSAMSHFAPFDMFATPTYFFLVAETAGPVGPRAHTKTRSRQLRVIVVVLDGHVVSVTDPTKYQAAGRWTLTESPPVPQSFPYGL